MIWWKILAAVWIGFSAGMVVAGGIFAFIAVIGIVPRLAQRTQTGKWIWLYEDCITVGGVLGTTAMFVPYRFWIGPVGVGIFGLAIGIFVGGLAVSLAEVLNVIPIFMRRSRLLSGIPAVVLAMALGKMAGELLYALIPGFFIG